MSLRKQGGLSGQIGCEMLRLEDIDVFNSWLFANAKEMIGAAERKRNTTEKT